MSSIQERLQLKRVPLDTWNIREKLCLASAVVRSGDQNWMSVSRALKAIGDPDRPADWYSQKSCAAQYGLLLENVETPKRKKRSSDGAAETPQESILKKLTQERIQEIQKKLGEITGKYNVLKKDIEDFDAGKLSEEKQQEIMTRLKADKQAEEQEKQKMAALLKEREERKMKVEKSWRPTMAPSNNTQTPPPSSPLLTSLLKSSPVVTTPQRIIHPASIVDTVSPSAGAPTLSMLLEKPSPPPPPAVPHPSLTSPSLMTSPALMTSPVLMTPPAPIASPAVMTSPVVIASPAPPPPLPPKVPDNKDAAIEQIKNQLQQLEQQLKVKAAPAPAMVEGVPTSMPLSLPMSTAQPVAGVVGAVGVVVAPDPTAGADKIDIDDIEIKAEDVYAFSDIDIEIPPVSTIHKSTLNRSMEKTIFNKKDSASMQVSLEDIVPTVPAPAQSQISETHTPPSSSEPYSTTHGTTIEDPNEDSKPGNAPEVKFPSTEVKFPSIEVKVPLSEVKFPSPEVRPPPEVKIPHPEMKYPFVEVKFPSAEVKVPQPDVSEETKVQVTIPATETARIDVVETPKKEIPEVSHKEQLEEETTKEPNVSAPEATADVTSEDKNSDVVESSSLSKPTEVESASESVTSADVLLTEVVPLPENVVTVTEESIKDDDVSERRHSNGSTEASESRIDAIPLPPEIHPQSIPLPPDIEEEQPEAEAEEKEVPKDDVEVKQELEEVHTETDDDTPMELIREEEGGKKRRDYSRRKNVQTESRSSESAAEMSEPASPLPHKDADPDKEYKLWKKSIMLVYDRLCAHKYASLFTKPITNEQAPSYSLVVKRPMDLSTIKKNIEQGVIKTTSEFQRDVFLMLSNALVYNQSTHSVHTMTREMYDEAKAQFGMLLQAQAHAQLTDSPRATPAKRKHTSFSSQGRRRQND